MRWARHVTRTEKKKNTYMVLVGKSERKRPLGTPSVDGRIILKLILKNKIGYGMNLARYRDKWRTVANMK
jgi:hypothetical protein